MSNRHRDNDAQGVIAGLVIAAPWRRRAFTPALHQTAPLASPAVAMGGHLTVSGEAEVGNPWTPAAMRCDSYCFMRARTFFDSVAVFGDDGQVHGMLAESIEPNDDYTEWTITVREGISFTDGTPVDAAAVIDNLQASGTRSARQRLAQGRRQGSRSRPTPSGRSSRSSSSTT